MKPWRCLSLLLALSAAYIGFEECRLRLQCPAPVDITLEDLAKRTEEGPIWVRLEASAPRSSPMILATDSGNSKGTLVGLTSPADPATLRAVLLLDDAGTANRLQTFREPLRIEGIAYLPGKDLSGSVRFFSESTGLKSGPAIRVIDPSLRPSGLVGSVLLLLAGILSTLWIVLMTDFRAWLLSALNVSSETEEVVHTLPTYEVDPLPEDVKVEVHDMLNEVWEKASD